MICTVLKMFRVRAKSTVLAKVLLVSAAIISTSLSDFVGKSYAEPKTKTSSSQRSPSQGPSLAKSTGKTSTNLNRDSGASIAIVVDNDVITKQEIEERINLIIFSSGIKSDAASRKTVRSQVEQALINERVQLRVINSQKITVTDEDVMGALANIARDNQMTSAEMIKRFTDSNVNINTLKDRLRVQIGWARVVRQSIPQDMKVLEVEVKSELEKIKQNRNEDQCELFEIFLRVDDNSSQEKVRKAAEDIYEQLKKGANFQVLAQQFSEATSATAGDYVGWFVNAQLEAVVREAISKIKVGEATRPVRTNIGYKIFYLKDTLKLGKSASGQMVSYKQVLVPYNDEMSFEEKAKAEQNIADLEKAKSVREFEANSKVFGYDCQDLANVTLGSLHPNLRTILAEVKVGKVIGPIRLPAHLLIMIIADRKEALEKIPTTAEIRERLEQAKYSNFANREFNKCLAAAHVHYMTE